MSQSRKPGKGKRRRIAVGCGDRPHFFISVTEEDISYGYINYRKRVQQNGRCHSQAAIGNGRGVCSIAALGGIADAGRAEYRSGAGDWIGLIQGYIKDGGLVLGLAIAVLGFLWIAYLGFAKFNEARQGKAEWAEVGVLGIVGAIVLIFASYLLTEAAGVI